MLGFRALSQSLLATADSQSQHRSKGVDSVVASIVEIPVLDAQSVENHSQFLRVLVLDIVLLDPLVVDDIEQARQHVNVDIDAE